MGLDVAVTQLHAGAQRANTVDVQVHRPGADRASAGSGNPRASRPRQQRPQHEE